MNLGTLAVSMVANIKNFTQGMARAQKDAAKTGNVLRAVFPKTSKYFDGISESLSIANSAMTKFTNNADLAAQATDGIGLAITKAATDESLRKIFKDLNVDIGKLSKAEPEKQLLMMSDAFRKLKDPTKQAAMSMQLFGKNTAVANAFIGPKGMAKYLPLLKIGLLALIPVVMGAATAIGGFLASQVQKGIASLDKLAKAARNVGTSVEEMRVLQFGISLAGGTEEDAERAVQKANEFFGRVILGNAEAIKTLEGMGIAADEAVKLPALQRFNLLMQALAKIEDPARRAALATKVLGENNKAAIGWALSSAKAYDETADKAKKLGLIWEGMDKDAKAAEAMSDSAEILGQQFDAMTQQMSGKAAPTLTTYIDGLSKLLGLWDEFIEKSKALYKAVNPLGSWLSESLGFNIFGGPGGVNAILDMFGMMGRSYDEIAAEHEKMKNEQMSSIEEISAAQEQADREREEREEKYKKLLKERMDLAREWREAAEDAAMDRAEEEAAARNRKAGVLTSTGYMNLAGMAGARSPDRAALNEQRKANKLLERIAANTKERKAIEQKAVLA